jgi:hypothetical protein
MSGGKFGNAKFDVNPEFGRKLGDYDEWYKGCEHCGYDPGKSNRDKCWKCGRKVQRDFSNRALKKGGREDA